MEKSKLPRPVVWRFAKESSLAAYDYPFNLSSSEPTLVRIRAWLRGQYPSLGVLNAEGHGLRRSIMLSGGQGLRRARERVGANER